MAGRVVLGMLEAAPREARNIWDIWWQIMDEGRIKGKMIE